MTTNCQWCQAKIETYFSEDLGPEDLRLFQDHVASCVECRDQVNGLKAIDPMVHQVFHRRLSQARRAALWNAGPRVWRVALAGSGIAVAALVGLGMLTLRPEAPPQTATQTPAIVEPATIEPIIDKTQTDPATAPQVLKPGVGVPVPPAPQPDLDIQRPDGPDFVIIDGSGYAMTLENLRGRVLLFGIISSDQKEAVANLQDLHQAYGADPKVRVFGVPSHRDDKIDTTVPLWFNHASKLLGLKSGQFALVDAEGNIKLKGSLANATDVAKAGAQLSK